MDPGEQPDQLKGLTQIEEMLISPILTMMMMYRLKRGEYRYRGMLKRSFL